MKWVGTLKNCVLQTFNWKGCLSRKSYWQFVGVCSLFIFTFVGFSILGWPNQVLQLSPLLGLIFGFLLLSATIRRLHDSGHSGWWCLIGPLTLIGLLPLALFVVKKSRYVDNPYRKDTRQVSPEKRAVALVVGKKPEPQNTFLCA